MAVYGVGWVLKVKHYEKLKTIENFEETWLSTSWRHTENRIWNT